MLIRFTCPRGHKMSAPAERAGATGKCPECETLFEVPRPPADYDGKALLAAEEIVEFYCPNEHYLRSPARLQGKRGKCPQCGATFVVPSVGVAPAEEPASPPAPGSAPSAGGEETSEIVEAPDGLEAVEQIDPIAVYDPPPASSSSGSSSPVRGAEPDFSFVDQPPWEEQQDDVQPERGSDGSGVTHPLAALFERIWEESDREAVVELELKSGERIAPMSYAHDVSRGAFGVFGIRAPDGTHTVTVVAWDDIARIYVRELKELPPTMFN
jgi:predicted RNA-binding Zn-ribbon protein involved in translation (DUF1610 family)